MAIPKTRIIPVKVTDYIQEDTFDVFNKYKAEVTKSRQAQALASKLMKAYGGSFNTKRITYMKNIMKLAAVASLFASVSAFAHHPAADIVDPEVYEMIDENVTDTPHADLDFDDMDQAMSGR